MSATKRRLPAGSHCVWVYSGREKFLYQVVGEAWSPLHVRCVVYDFDLEAWWTREVHVRATWFKGATRRLVDALRAGAVGFEP